MSKWFIASTALILFAAASPVQADLFSSLNGGYASPTFTSAGGEIIMMGGKGIPSYSTPHGYPFYSGCCEPKSSCCASLWAGYRHRSRCHFGCKPRIHHGCGSCTSGKGFASKGAVQSGGCNTCGGKGLHSSCGTCAPKCGSKCGRHGLGMGLFGWLHSGCGCGPAIHTGCGCTSVKGGKGTSTYFKGGPVYDAPMNAAPMNDVPAPVVPPTPEPVSMQSAAKWLSPLRFLPLK